MLHVTPTVSIIPYIFQRFDPDYPDPFQIGRVLKFRYLDKSLDYGWYLFRPYGLTITPGGDQGKSTLHSHLSSLPEIDPVIRSAYRPTAVTTKLLPRFN